MLTQVKADYKVFIKLFRRLNTRTDILRKSLSLNINKEYNIFESRKKGIGFSLFSLEIFNIQSVQPVSFSLYKDKLDIFIPYNIIDNNLKNYLKTKLSKNFNLKYKDIDFVIGSNPNFNNNNLIQNIIKEPYLIQETILTLEDRMISTLKQLDDFEYPIVLEESLNITEPLKVNLLCSLELEVEFYSSNIIINNVNFFIADGKFSKLKLNNKRAYTIFQAATDYVFSNNNIFYDELNFLNLDFAEDGEFIFSFRAFFIASVSSLRAALTQAFNFDLEKTPIDFKEISKNWSIQIDF